MRQKIRYGVEDEGKVSRFRQQLPRAGIALREPLGGGAAGGREDHLLGAFEHMFARQDGGVGRFRVEPPPVKGHVEFRDRVILRAAKFQKMHDRRCAEQPQIAPNRRRLIAREGAQLVAFPSRQRFSQRIERSKSVRDRGRGRRDAEEPAKERKQQRKPRKEKGDAV